MNGIFQSVLQLIGGGAIGAIITSMATKRKIDAEAQSTNIQSILEVDARLNERLAKLEERVANLEQENIILKEENIRLRLKLGIEPDKGIEEIS